MKTSPFVSSALSESVGGGGGGWSLIKGGIASQAGPAEIQQQNSTIQAYMLRPVATSTIQNNPNQSFLPLAAADALLAASVAAKRFNHNINTTSHSGYSYP